MEGGGAAEPASSAETASGAAVSGGEEETMGGAEMASGAGSEEMAGGDAPPHHVPVDGIEDAIFGLWPERYATSVMRAAAAMRAPSRKYTSGCGLAAIGKQQLGDAPSGGLQRILHACEVAREYKDTGTVRTERQIKLKVGSSPKMSMLELLEANPWMLAPLLALHTNFEEHGLLASSALGSENARRNFALLERYRVSRADEYPQHGVRHLRLGSAWLLHAGLQRLMAYDAESEEVLEEAAVIIDAFRKQYADHEAEVTKLQVQLLGVAPPEPALT